MREALQEDHIDTKLIGIDELHGTGTALITLDAEGQTTSWFMVVPTKQ